MERTVIGKGIAIDALEKDNVVIIVGRNQQKGMEFLQHAEGIGAESRAFFLQADLSLVRENQRIIAEIGAVFPTLDIRYVLFNPGGVSTSFSGEYDSDTKQSIEQFKMLAKPVSEGIQPIIHRIEQPPSTAISAFIEGREIRLDHE